MLGAGRGIEPSPPSQCKEVKGSVPVTQRPQPPGSASPPGTSPGYIKSPEDVVTPDQIFTTADTCLGVKQDSSSMPVGH